MTRAQPCDMMPTEKARSNPKEHPQNNRKIPRKPPTFCYTCNPCSRRALPLPADPKGALTHHPRSGRASAGAGGRERQAKSLQLTGWTAGREPRANFPLIQKGERSPEGTLQNLTLQKLSETYTRSEARCRITGAANEKRRPPNRQEGGPRNRKSQGAANTATPL